MAPLLSARPRVLLVDDDAGVTAGWVRVLSDDFDVVAINSSQSALHQILAGRRFAVILCDLRLPDLTGMELHDEIARVSPGQAERMIFITGGGLPARLQAFADRKGALMKPVEGPELRRAIRARLDAEPASERKI